MSDTTPGSLAKKPLDSITNLFRQATNDLFNNFRKLLPILSIVLVSKIIIAVFTGLFMTTVLLNTATTVVVKLLFLIFIILNLLYIYIAILTTLGIIILVKHNYTLSTGEALAKAQAKFWSALWLGIIIIFLVGAGSIVFILPGIYLAIALIPAFFVLVSEDIRGGKAISRSFDLTKGYWWNIFGRTILFMLASILAQIIISALAYLPEIGVYVVLILSTILTLLVTALTFIFGFKIYQNLKRIKS
jgi:hypothetical protein